MDDVTLMLMNSLLDASRRAYPVGSEGDAGFTPDVDRVQAFQQVLTEVRVGRCSDIECS